MHVILSNDEIKEVLFHSLCDGGLELLAYCGVYIRYDMNDYTEARKAIPDGPTLEQVYVQMVMEKRRVYFLETADGESGEIELTLEKILEHWKSPEIQDDILEIYNGDADATPCYRVLQYALYGKLKWG